MDARRLRDALAHKSLRLDELRAADRRAYDAVAAVLAGERKQALARRLAGASESVRKALDALDPAVLAAEGAEAALRKALDKARAPAAEQDEAIAAVRPLLDAPAEPDRPVGLIPGVREALARLDLADMAEAARLRPVAAEALAKRASGLDAVSESTLAGLVRDKSLTEEEAKALGLRLSLYHLSGGDPKAADALAKARSPALGGGIAAAKDLLAAPEDEIVRILREGGVRPPHGGSLEETARGIKARLRERYPSEAIALEAAPPPERTLAGHLRAIAPLVGANGGPFSRDPKALDVRTLPEATRAAALEAHAALAKIVRRYPGLGLEKDIERGGDPGDIARRIASRTALVDRVAAQNPDKDLLAVDYGPHGAQLGTLKTGGLDEADRKGVLNVLKARQRVFALSRDAVETTRLMEAGYHSALALALDDPASIAAKSGLSPERAGEIHARAGGTLAGLAANVGALLDTTHGGFTLLGVNNLDPDVTDAVRKLDGYADLFGPQDFCDCEHCQSILSPAAYFADLMRFVDESVTKKVFTGARERHALKLSVRRPDLWTLPLNCENTETTLPTLDIVNEVLEAYIAHAASGARPADRGIAPIDRVAARRRTYEDILPAAGRSFTTPFVLPVAEVDVCIEPFETTRAALMAEAGLEGPEVAAAALGLSMEEYDLVVTARTDRAYLGDLYGIDIPLAVGAAAIDPVDVQDVLRSTGLTRAELGALAATATITAGGARTVTIRAEKRDAESVQNDVEGMRGLTPATLDAMHRFIRLWRRLPWSIPELDLVLAHRAPGAPAIDEAALAHVVAVKAIGERFGLSVEETCALYGDIPRTETAEGRRPLFDRLFNNRPYTKIDGELPDAAKRTHPAFSASATPSPDNHTLQRLLLGLQVSEEALADLVRMLASALGADLSDPDEEARGFALSAANLSLIYRHARLMALLRRSSGELAQLLAFAGLPDGVRALADLERLLALHDWQRTSGLSLDDILVLTGRTPSKPEAYPAAGDLAAAIVARAEAEGALVFADTVFAFAPGVSEDLSRAIAEENVRAGLFEALAEEERPLAKLRLAAATPADADLALPADVAPELGGALKAVVARHHVREVLPGLFAAELGLDRAKLEALATLAGIDFGAPSLAAALHGGSRGDLEAVARVLAKLALLFAADAFTPERISFVAGHLELFGVDDVDALTLESIRRLTTYRTLLAPSPPPREPAQAPDPTAVDEALAAFTGAHAFAAVDPDRLGAALGAPGAVAATLRSLAVPGADAVPALARLAALAKRARESGLGADAIKLLASSDPATLARGAEALVTALRRKHPDEKDFQARLEPLEDRLRGRKRDALADYVIRNSHERFETLDDLYAYFLIDPQLQGCARTSRVIAAISAVQTYVHRILLNLERDRRDANDPEHVHVLPSRIDMSQWWWRKSYRVWEANRKVFLWPESYIEPELRDDKTPLFQELEDALLQRDITEQSALDAYGNYLAGFEQLAGLKIAGAYHEQSGSEDLLHLFGCTTDDPPIYYYWTVSNLALSRTSPNHPVAYAPRRRIDVSIPARAVSPIVHQGRLHVFWNEIVTTPENSEFDGGTSRFVGYKHKITTRFTSLRVDGSWTPPKALAMIGSTLVQPGVVVFDSVRDEVPNWSIEPVAHTKPRDDYGLAGAQWERVYPTSVYGRLLMTAGGLSTFADVDLFNRAQIALQWSDRYEAELFSYEALEWGHERRQLHLDKPAQDGAPRALYMPLTGAPSLWLWWLPSTALLTPFARQAALADHESFERLPPRAARQQTDIAFLKERAGLTPALRGSPVAHVRDALVMTQAVNGAPGGAGLVIQGPRDSFYLFRDGDGVRAHRLGTTLARDLSRTVFAGGINALLDIETQRRLQEERPLARSLAHGPDDKASPIDFDGPMGAYFREIFFHIPFLIANHLSARGKFAAAQRWYHYVFDPTAADPDAGLAGLDDAAREQALRDRVWRYLPFRNQTIARLRDILTNPAAIAAYKEDPFNPHAIARLRPTAYQKAVVMRYVTNLIEWGDSLFRQFTTESVNEALVLYVLASEILGRRPADVGECGEGEASPRTYETIAPLLDRIETGEGSELLLEGETAVLGPLAERLTPISHAVTSAPGAGGEPMIEYVRPAAEKRALETIEAGLILAEASAALVPGGEASLGASLAADTAPARAAEMASPLLTELTASRASTSAVSSALDRARRLNGSGSADRAAGDGALSNQLGWSKTRTLGWEARNGGLAADRGVGEIAVGGFRAGDFGLSLIRQLVFCVPRNKDLDALWSRVEDRLYKIRHCLDITGARRDLALLAPEIDPRLLVRARAEGLSLDDILGGLAGDLPPYRFTFVIEKAKQYASAVQGFGAQLLAAIEKRDVEELSRLRNTHQANMLKLSTRVREWELKGAEEAIAQLEKQKQAAERRRDYYAGLLDTDLLPWEKTQQTLRHASTTSYVLGTLFLGTGGILHLLPGLGSPFAMKYGGKEVGDSAADWGHMFSDTAKMLDVFAASAGLEASFERRRVEWEHQRDLADLDIQQIDKQIAAAGIRREIAAKAIELHQKEIENHDEIMELFETKFSKLGLYAWLATGLQRLYRRTFNSALAMARLAERAYRFERGDETTPLLEAPYWDAPNAGLLAGEGLSADLIEMERRFIETNYRALEIDQAFSLMQLDPEQLMALRETGECAFTIPELAFDLFYPGHYRRRIKAVRLSIPCVTGPYVNVAATLRLDRAFVRQAPDRQADLAPTPLRHTTTIATSSARADAGVFAFDFRDERYMPFEGAGAVDSRWIVTLPKSFRPFDYQTISDVIVQLSYTALADDRLKALVEGESRESESLIAQTLAETPIARAISLRQDQSGAFHQLLASPSGTRVTLAFDERLLPIFLRGVGLSVAKAHLLARLGAPAAGEPPLTAAGFAIRLNGQRFDDFSITRFPGHRAADVSTALSGGLLGTHEITIDAAGELAPDNAAAAAACDPRKLLDLVLLVELRAGAGS